MADQANEKWLDKLLAGDHEAFAEFVDKYKEMVFLCCRLLGLREDEIEDAASETFMAAYKGIGRYKGQAELSTWLWRIAYRKGVDCLRQNRRGAEALLFVNNGNILAEAGPEGKEHTELVWDAVERLPKLWAMATVLFYREEKEIKEIAKIMQVRQNTVKTYLFRARKKLKEILGHTNVGR